MLHLFKRETLVFERCFNIETAGPLSDEELLKLRRVLADSFSPRAVVLETALRARKNQIIEVGPRLNFATFWCTNFLSLCRAIGLDKIIRAERSRRYVLSPEEDISAFIADVDNVDRMTECVYERPLETFETGIKPVPIWQVRLIEDGPEALLKVEGIAMDEFDRKFIWDYFVNYEKRNPTIAEILDLNNANSEHCRHWIFNGKRVIDGQEMPETLFQIVKAPWKKNRGNSLFGFDDNAGAIRGGETELLVPRCPGQPSSFDRVKVILHPTDTAETHNFPTGVSPFGGAETGTGGRQRDNHDVRRGARLISGSAGYCVSNLNLPGLVLPWEERKAVYPSELATGRQIEIKASDGASDYGNKSGEPILHGFTNSIDITLPDGERWAFIKPIMYTSGTGVIDDRHIGLLEYEKGMVIIQIGGPAYRIGKGGGAASSLHQGDQAAQLDFNAVQRGDGEMARKVDRALYACVCLGDNNPIVRAHDQGAGGVANAVKEATGKAGGRINIRKINVGDQTMSDDEIYVCEYQERECFVVWADRVEEFQAICTREKVNCEVLGEITGDGRFVVYDDRDGSEPVNLNLGKVMEDLPQKIYNDARVAPNFPSLEFSDSPAKFFPEALWCVMHMLSVGSKRFLVKKVDRSVKGLVAQQQCCGPLQLTVADCAVEAWSHFGLSGTAKALGEKSFLMIGDSKAGARMSVIESLTNLAAAKISALENVKCRANWMMAPKKPGEGAALYDAACAMRDLMMALGIAADGGKDSSSMSTIVKGENVKSPRTLVIHSMADMLDIRCKATPDLKEPGESLLVHIDLALGKRRLGGSALAQAYKQIGNEFPDIDNVEHFVMAFSAQQRLLQEGLILSYHDVSGGGLITTVLEMAFSGNCGFSINVNPDNFLGDLFAEEAGMVLECRKSDYGLVIKTLAEYGVVSRCLGQTRVEKTISIQAGREFFYQEKMIKIRSWWEELSYCLDREQINPDCADEEWRNIQDRTGPHYSLSFTPAKTLPEILTRKDKPKAVVLREEGTNGEDEARSVLDEAGFEVWDVNMDDLLKGKISLEQFQFLFAAGGFSYADVPGSAKGWASTIRFNPRLARMFGDFYYREDTLSLGVCNGCQLFALLGWVPWAGIDDEKQPRFVRNISAKFESRWSTVKIYESSSILFSGMAGSVLGVPVAHGDGRIEFPCQEIFRQVMQQNLVSLGHVDDDGSATEEYPFNPNHSPLGITGICTSNGRHTVMMPHPERAFLTWQWHYLPAWQEREWGRVSPWLKMFQNAREWCERK